jgi:hypothetical protein
VIAMSPRQRAVGSALTLMVLVAIATSATFWVLGTDDTAGQLFVSLFSLVVPAVYGGVGVVLTTRLPQNSVGWLCLLIGLAWGIVNVGDAISAWALDHVRVTMASWTGLASSLWLVAVGLTSHLALRLPSGRLLSERWRRYSWFCTAVIVAVAVVVLTQPGPVSSLDGTENPIGVPRASAIVVPLFVLFILSFVGSVASLPLRYRRAEMIERLQIRWIALGGSVIVVVGAGIAVPTALGVLSLSGGLPAPVAVLDALANIAIPLSIGIAVMRYRLYDIDLVINRTLVYGALTATLATTYGVLIVLFQLVLDPLTHDSSLATAASTLVVAAIFRPARARIQGVVDHRFYRRKYDAERTLEAFQERLRDEVDLTVLSRNLRTVVDETMQPAHVSLWMWTPRASPDVARDPGPVAVGRDRPFTSTPRRT